MALNSYLLIVPLNVNGLNAPIQRHIVSDWIRNKTHRYETHFRPNDTPRLKVRGWKTIHHANGHQKKAGVAILIPDKLDLNQRL